ncbi:hypothetical protein WJX84_002433 [Apatococcus fuscideae]|uniref:THUMP domain-containing protein n=1 Tax=Apatococcus fuscideae TaxID=2026836 RepID=A0AAW1SRB1_9CHLO
MGDKRPAEGQGRSADRSKRNKYFQSNQKAGLPNGSKGFLISCFGGKELPASREAISLLSQFYDAGSDGAATDTAAAGAVADGKPLDLSDAIANEVAELKEHSNDIFTFHKTNVNGLLYVSMAASADKMSPCELAKAIATEIKRTQQCRSRLCIRFLPVEDVCHADIESIKKHAAVLVAKHFPASPDLPPIEFSVDYEHRASVKLDRMAVINTVADLVPKPPHKRLLWMGLLLSSSKVQPGAGLAEIHPAPLLVLSRHHNTHRLPEVVR